MIATGFLDLAPELSSFNKSLFTIIGVPYDATCTWKKGSRNGPKAILEASPHLETFDEELQIETCQAGIHTHPLLPVGAARPARVHRMIHDVWAKALAAGKVPVMLGGEHSISFGAVQAAKERYGSLQVLHFDAHADLRNTYYGSPFNHGCIARRLLEMAPVTQVGIRSLSIEEHKFMQTRPKGLKTFFAQEMRRKNISPRQICKNLRGNLYITFDLDCLDPSIMPSTGTPEPGGLFWEEVLAILRQATRQCRIVGFDINELCPLPGNIAPDFLAAKLAYRIMGYIEKTGTHPFIFLLKKKEK